jgi:hypothetical protein
MKDQPMFIVVAKEIDWGGFERVPKIAKDQPKDWCLIVKGEFLATKLISKLAAEAITPRLIVVSPPALQELFGGLSKRIQFVSGVFIHGSGGDTQTKDDAVKVLRKWGEGVVPEAIYDKAVAITLRGHESYRIPQISRLFAWLKQPGEGMDARIPIDVTTGLDDLDEEHRRFIARYYAPEIVEQALKVQGIWIGEIKDPVKQRWLGELKQWLSNDTNAWVFSDPDLGRPCLKLMGLTESGKNDLIAKKVPTEVYKFIEAAKMFVSRTTPSA